MDAAGWDARYSATELIWTAEPNRFLVAEVADLPPGRAVDLACGEGRNAVWLATLGWQVTGVDFSSVGLDKGRAMAAERGVDVDFVHADVTAWTPEPGTFDLVAILYLQVPAADREAVLGHAVDGLAPGGSLVVIGHDSRNLTEGYGGPQDPAVLYGPEDLVPLLGALEVDKAERVDRPVETDDGTKVAIDVVVRAHKP